MQEENKYAAENISEKLNWNEHIRKRPAMYIGAVNNKGFTNLVKGILTDTIPNTESDTFQINLSAKNKGSLRFKNIKKPIAESWAIFIKPPSFYEVQAMNALCNNFTVSYFNQNRQILEQKFNRGESNSDNIGNVEIKCDEVEIQFELDKEIWGNDFTWNENYLLHELKEFSYLHKRTKFEIEYQVDGEPCKVIYHFKNGLKDKIEIEKLNGLGSSYFETYIDEQIEDFRIEIAFAFREYSVDEKFLKSYVNDHYTHENGSHVDGLLKGLTYGVMKHFQKYHLTEKYKISEKGMEENLIAALNIRTENAVFSGCVKNKLANPEIIEPIANYIAELLFKKIEEDKESTERLIRKFEI